LADVEYGVTQSGFVRKRYDTIFLEMQSRLSDNETGFGFDVSQNPQSLLNVFLASFAGKVSELWQLAEQVYYSQYISTAEGVNLDNAAAYGGVKRELAARSRFSIACTGVDGTRLSAGQRLATRTDPKIYVENLEDYFITRGNCTSITISVGVVADNSPYSITINDIAFPYTSGASATALSILQGLAAALGSSMNTFMTATVDTEAVTMTLTSTENTANRVVSMSDTLNANSVTSVLTFYASEYGEVYVPEGKITEKITTPVNLTSVTNIGEPVLGRLTETDIEFRQSYIKKIASRSSTMLDSIISGILTGVKDIVSCMAYENNTDAPDMIGNLPIAPHSVLVIVDCPDSRDEEVAAMILKKKAAGIGTNGTTVKQVAGLYSEPIEIRFYKPTDTTIYFKVEYTRSSSALPANYQTLIKDTIVSMSKDLKAGDTIVPQDWITAIKSACSGISYLSIKVSDDGSTWNDVYQLGVANVPAIAEENISIIDPS